MFIRASSGVIALRDDGVDPVTLGTPGARLLSFELGTSAGELRFPESLLGISGTPKALLLAEPSAGGRIAIRRVDASSRRITAELGALPLAYQDPVVLEDGSGTATLLIARIDGKADVFYVDADRPGSLRQLTHTPDVDERLVGRSTQDCGTAGGASLWALAGLALARVHRASRLGRRSRLPRDDTTTVHVSRSALDRAPPA